MFVFNLPKRTCLLSQAKKPPTSVGGSYVGITYLPGQAKYCTAVKKQSGGLF